MTIRGMISPPARSRANRSLILAAALALASIASAQLQVVSTSPGMNASNIQVDTAVSVTFDVPVLRSSFVSDDFWAFGRSSGALVGTIGFSNDDRTVTLTPDRRLQVGDVVTVVLSRNLQAAVGGTLRAAGYSWQFTTRTRCAGTNYTQIANFTNRIAGGQTRIYGGIVTDFNADASVDIATINEVSSDMRMFLNRADGSGLFQPMLAPPLPLAQEISPNDVSDFNRDGNADFVVSASAVNQSCIALGNGNGTFAPAQILNVSTGPHGCGALDFDGDGDMDIAVATAGGLGIDLLRNNGAGVFSIMGSIASGGSGAYGLIVAEMNNDGILDLVLGNTYDGSIGVLRCNGNGSFTITDTGPIGGPVWVINAGDLNNDGNMDIVAANAFAANGAILMGNGAGQVGNPTTYASPGHTPSTDIGDLDGDGDLDWVLSAFGGEAWRVYLNNGAGVFSFLRDLAAPDNPSCASLNDLDSDGDLDIVLFDEIADVVILQRNNSARHAGDVDLDGDVDLTDLSILLSNFGSGGATPADGDLNRDGNVNLSDLSLLLGTFGSGCP